MEPGFAAMIHHQCFAREQVRTLRKLVKVTLTYFLWSSGPFMGYLWALGVLICTMGKEVIEARRYLS